MYTLKGGERGGTGKGEKNDITAHSLPLTPTRL